MTPEVSVILPAFRAQATIAEAAASSLSGQGIAVELVICSDDHLDYRALLRDAGIGVEAVVQCRTPTPRSGPSAARNIAVDAARAPVLAALDADDAYAPGRLRAVLDAMTREGVGAGSGVTLEGLRGEAPVRIARTDAAQLTLAEICGLRMPFSPVFERGLAPDGWPEVGFAEDMVLNAHLCATAGGYAFAQDAAYHYHVEPDSVVQGDGSLQAALVGYAQILDWLPTSWVHDDARAEIRMVIEEDRRTAERALAEGGRNWRESFRA